MIFLQAADYEKQIRNDQLAQVTGTNSGILDDAELACLSEMQSYLRASYDVAKIFKPLASRTESEPRDAYIIMLAVDICLYHLHSAVVPRNIPEVRITRYESAIKWLTMVKDGKLSPDLPVKPLEPGETAVLSGFHIISKKRNQWFY